MLLTSLIIITATATVVYLRSQANAPVPSFASDQAQSFMVLTPDITGCLAPDGTLHQRPEENETSPAACPPGTKLHIEFRFESISGEPPPEEEEAPPSD